MSKGIITAVSLLALAACGTTLSTAPADAFKVACSGLSIAHGDFQAVAPPLLAAGKLSQADIDKEAAAFATLEVTCTNPPADLVTAQQQLLAGAAAIYLLLSRA